jgi:hypothetical protein
MPTTMRPAARVVVARGSLRSRRGGRAVWSGSGRPGRRWLTAGVVRPSGTPSFPLARVGPTTPKHRARNDILGSFGRSDRTALRGVRNRVGLAVSAPRFILLSKRGQLRPSRLPCAGSRRKVCARSESGPMPCWTGSGRPRCCGRRCARSRCPAARYPRRGHAAGPRRLRYSRVFRWRWVAS